MTTTRKRNIILIVIGALLLIAGIVVLVLMFSGRQKRYAWIPHFESRGLMKKQPYGTYYLRQLMERRGGSGKMVRIRKPLQQFFSNPGQQRGVYVFIGYSPFYTEEAGDALLSFASAGNTVFLGVNKLPSDLIFRLSLDEGEMSATLNEHHLAWVNTSLRKGDSLRTWKFWHQESHLNTPFQWKSMDTAVFNNRNLPGQILGTLNGKDITYYRIAVGKGQILLHCNPIFYSNYFLVTREGYDYASTLFRFIPNGSHIYFDDYSNAPPSHPSRGKTAEGALPASWLEFILTSPGLQWTWSLLAVMGLLYLLFRSRRVQRPIPVVVPNINTTLEYVKTVGQIYFRNKNHRQLALLQKQLLMQHLASRYSIRLNASSEQLRREVMIRTGITEELAVKLFRAIAMLEERKKITAEELVHWYETLDQFYQTNQKRYGNIQQSAGNRI